MSRDILLPYTRSAMQTSLTTPDRPTKSVSPNAPRRPKSVGSEDSGSDDGSDKIVTMAAGPKVGWRSPVRQRSPVRHPSPSKATDTKGCISTHEKVTRWLAQSTLPSEAPATSTSQLPARQDGTVDLTEVCPVRSCPKPERLGVYAMVDDLIDLDKTIPHPTTWVRTPISTLSSTVPPVASKTASDGTTRRCSKKMSSTQLPCHHPVHSYGMCRYHLSVWRKRGNNVWMKHP